MKVKFSITSLCLRGTYKLDMHGMAAQKWGKIMNEDEIICSCMGTTVRDIMDAVENGAKTVEDIEAVTQAGTVCGACIDEIEALLEKLKNK